MATLEVQDLKSKTGTELLHLLAQKREELRALRFDLSQKKVKNVRTLHKTKKDIARILTILNLKPSK